MGQILTQNQQDGEAGTTGFDYSVDGVGTVTQVADAHSGSHSIKAAWTSGACGMRFQLTNNTAWTPGNKYFFRNYQKYSRAGVTLYQIIYFLDAGWSTMSYITMNVTTTGGWDKVEWPPFTIPLNTAIMRVCSDSWSTQAGDFLQWDDCTFIDAPSGYPIRNNSNIYAPIFFK
jgi:hypothetical protein